MTAMRTLSRVVGLAAVVLLTGGGVAHARPPHQRPSSKGGTLLKRPAPLAEELLREELAARIAERRLLPLSNSTARAASGPACESTGFEATEATCQWEQGWICGSTFTSCVSDHDIPQVCTGDTFVDENCCADNPNPLNGWYVSIASQHCNEPHVDTANPASGTQHLRFQRDPEGGELSEHTDSGCIGLNSACRVSAFTPSVGPQPIGPTTISFDLSISAIAGGASGSMNYFTVALSETKPRGPNFFWSGYNGYIYVYDNSLGAYGFAGSYLYSGRYHHFDVVVNPCSDVVTYTQNGTLIYSHDFTLFAKTVEFAVFSHSNAGDTVTWDLDNYTVTRGEPCPINCGDGELGVNEECDVGFDDCCPGRCVPPGEDGECSCAFPPHSLFDCDPQELDNGTNGPFRSSGGFFSYTPDTPFTSVDTCGSSYDTQILWDINPECTDYRVFNDSCTSQDLGGEQVPGDPSAPCFSDAPFSHLARRACLCQPTTPGVPVTFLVDAYTFTLLPPFCSDTIVNINKKLVCGAPIIGACCDRVAGSCVDVERSEDCAGQTMLLSEGRTCDLVECLPAVGACCDRFFGTCEDPVALADCLGSDDVFTEGRTCNEIECLLAGGACCDFTAGSCNVVASVDDCSDQNMFFSEGRICEQVSCFTAVGACCDSVFGTCRDSVPLANCLGLDDVFTDGHSCDEVDCARGDGAPFAERVISTSTSAGNPTSVFATDVDGDGDKDILVAFFFSKIAWYENDGGSPPTFTERVISTAADGAESVFATDLDGDGDVDVLSSSIRDDKIAWYENDGGSPPTFTERVITEDPDENFVGVEGFADEPYSVFAADVDGDGDTDVLSASAADNKIAWYENDGGLLPTFTGRVISSSAGRPHSVFATDVDGDGDTDVLSASSQDDKIAWYENDGGSPPTFTERVISTDANGAWSVFAADVDGDGDTDVLSASRFDDKIAWYESDGGSPPAFTERVISLAADDPLAVFATDVDGDGDTDVLSASQGDDKIAWYENDGGSPPTFTERLISTTADAANSVFATDLDGDGDTDVISTSGRGYKVAWYENRSTLCGNGRIDPGEECDDGNVEPGDGCDETCLIRGACCDALRGTCMNRVSPESCQGTHASFHLGVDCHALDPECAAAFGACCRDELDQPGGDRSCTSVILDECKCPTCEWFKLSSCEDVIAEALCEPDFFPIPALSQWGLAIMTLLLLVAGKVYFGRRDAWRRSDSRR